MMFPIDYNGDVLNHNARVGVDGGIVESTDFLADFSEQTKRVNMPLLLDIYPNAAAAYSLRKLRTAYTGSAIRVRRSSDNTETDIGFNNAGDLDTSALAAFVGNGNGFVTRWYDQSGNDRHATQTGTTEQPLAVSSGSLVTMNTKPSLNFNTATTRLRYQQVTNFLSQPTTIFATVQGVDVNGQRFISDGSNLNVGQLAIQSSNVLGIYAGTSLQVTSTTPLTSVFLAYALFNTTTSQVGVNSNIVTGGAGNANMNNAITLGISGDFGPRGLRGKLTEYVIYPNNNSANRIGIETNINSYYRIYQQEALLLDYYPDAAAAYSLRKLRSGYTGAAIQVRRSSDNAVQNIGFDSNGGLDTTALTTFVGTGNTGFVTTWYDQSGNNNHATQSTTANQPVIFSAGAIISENTKPSIYFNNGNTVCLNLTSTINTNPFTILWVSKKDNTGIQGSIVLSGSRGGFQYIGDDVDNQGLPNAFAGNSTGIIRTSLSNTSNSGNEILQHLSYLNRRNSIEAVGQYNNSNNSYNTNISSTNIIIDSIANYGVAYNYVGKIQEIIIYSSDKSQNRGDISSNINSYYNIYPTDSDANAFVTAAALTNTTQIQAVNKLVTDLKGYGLWGKMKAIYPFVGGTADSHKFNLKDPRDVDGAFRLVFSGGWTHSATGALPDGSTGYADTRLLATNLNSNSLSMSYYSRTNNLSSKTLIGTRLSTNWINLALIASGLRTLIGQGGTNFDISIPNSLGFLLTNRVSDNLLNLWKNTKVGTDTTLSSAAIIAHNLTLSALNSAGTIVNYNNLECAFATIGDGLTDTEAANLYTAVQAFQTTLGRQV